MKNRLLTLLITIIIATTALTAFCSCSREKTFGKQSIIDGTDVSGMTYSEAKQLVEKNHSKLLSELKYTIRTDTKSICFTARGLGISFDTENTLKRVFEKPENATTKLKIDENVARENLKILDKELSTGAEEAKAEYDACGEFVFYKAKSGSKPEIDSILESLKNALNSAKSETLIAKMSSVEATGTSYEELKENNSVIAEFTTFFNRNPLNAKGRVNNIKKGANLVNGTTINPGECFNTNKILGDRNKENGWFMAAGIRDGKYNQEYGGGVCQISTTIYNAALLANLEIVERNHHTWPITYVDIGRDATISTDGPNFIFKNNTQNTLTVCALVNEDKESLTVKLFGKKPKHYSRVEIESKQTGTITAPETEYVYNNELSKGEYVQDRKARNGKKAVTYRYFYDENDKLIKTETVTKDIYRPVAARIYYG